MIWSLFTGKSTIFPFSTRQCRSVLWYAQVHRIISCLIPVLRFTRTAAIRPPNNLNVPLQGNHRIWQWFQHRSAICHWSCIQVNRHMAAQPRGNQPPTTSWLRQSPYGKRWHRYENVRETNGTPSNPIYSNLMPYNSKQWGQSSYTIDDQLLCMGHRLMSIFANKKIDELSTYTFFSKDVDVFEERAPRVQYILLLCRVYIMWLNHLHAYNPTTFCSRKCR